MITKKNKNTSNKNKITPFGKNVYPFYSNNIVTMDKILRYICT